MVDDLYPFAFLLMDNLDRHLKWKYRTLNKFMSFIILIYHFSKVFLITFLLNIIYLNS